MLHIQNPSPKTQDRGRHRWRRPLAGAGHERGADTVVIDRVLRDIPADVRDTFTAAQIGALGSALAPPRASDTFKFEVSLPFFGRRYFFVVMSGREKRSIARLAADGQASTARIAGTYAALVGLIIGLMVASALVMIYAVGKIAAS